MPNVKAQSSNECQMTKFKLQIKLKCQILSNPPLLKSVRLATEGGEGGLSIDFEFFHSFDIWILTFEILDSVSYRVLSSLDS